MSTGSKFAQDKKGCEPLCRGQARGLRRAVAALPRPRHPGQRLLHRPQRQTLGKKGKPLGPLAARLPDARVLGAASSWPGCCLYSFHVQFLNFGFHRRQSG